MNGLFGPYIEKWMHFVTIKNMLLLAIGSVIITDLGLHLLRAIFPRIHLLIFFITFLKALFMKVLYGKLLVLLILQ